MEIASRRVAAGVLMAFGVVLMLVAPDTLSGLMMIGLAVAIEIAGLVLDRRR